MGWPGSAQRKALGRQGCLRAHWVGLGLSRSQVGLHIPPRLQQLPPEGLTVLLRAQIWRASSLCSWQVRLPGPRWSGDEGVSEQVPWQVIRHLGVSYREERKDGEDGVRAGGFLESPALSGLPLTGHMARTKVSAPARPVHSLALPQLPQRPWSGCQAWVLGQQRHLSGQSCLRGGPLPSVSGPQGLGQRRTVRNVAAAPHAKGEATTPRPSSSGSGAHGAQGQRWGCASRAVVGAGGPGRRPERRPPLYPSLTGRALSSWENLGDQLTRLHQMLAQVQHIAPGHTRCETLCPQIPDFKAPDPSLPRTTPHRWSGPSRSRRAPLGFENQVGCHPNNRLFKKSSSPHGDFDCTMS